jgi:hypothetical protein
MHAMLVPADAWPGEVDSNDVAGFHDAASELESVVLETSDGGGL